MNREEHFSHLNQLLQAERDAVRQLADCLAQERSALATMDSPLLEDTVQHKQQLLQALEQYAGERARLAGMAGYGADSGPMQQYLSWADRDGTLLRHWSELLERLRDCQQHNRVNGGAIELGRQQVKMILGMLRGQHQDIDNTYQANGRTPSGLAHRILGSA